MTTRRRRWRAQRFSHVPSKVDDPCANRQRLDPGASRPVRKGECFSLVRQVVIGGLVLHLLHVGNPAHITWLVVSVDIDAVDAVLFGGRRSDISKECFKRLVPPLANPNTTPAIERVRREVRILATPAHVDPRMIFLGSGHPMGSPKSPRRDIFTPKATATLGDTAAQLLAARDDYGPAVAATSPEGPFGLLRIEMSLDDEQPTKSLAGEVDKLHNKTPLCRASLKGGARSEKPRVGTLARRAQAPMHYANYSVALNGEAA